MIWATQRRGEGFIASAHTAAQPSEPLARDRTVLESGSALLLAGPTGRRCLVCRRWVVDPLARVRLGVGEAPMLGRPLGELLVSMGRVTVWRLGLT